MGNITTRFGELVSTGVFAAPVPKLAPSVASHIKNKSRAVMLVNYLT
jgi:hypothetical protein